MKAYRKKPVVVQAVQFTKEMAEGSESLPSGVTLIKRETINGKLPNCMMDYADNECAALRELAHYDHYHRHVIKTLEGDMEVKIGDWVITGVNGEHYPCKPDIFEKTYEPA